MTKDAIAAEGQARGVPVAPVLGVAEVLASRHFESRGAFVDAEVAPGVHGRLPSGFCEIDGKRVGFRHRAPEPGEHDDVLSRARDERPARPAGRPQAATGAVPSRPLAGLRVVDFGIIVIGNEIGRLLADQGADVIKIENRAFPDAARVGYGGKLSHSFVAGSRNKRSFGVNLRTPEGVALLKRLVAGADVVLENFKPGTLEKLGLGYESLRAVKPDLVMLSTNALGSTGPWSRWLGYGPIVRCVSGITSLWRYPEDELGFGEPTTIYPDHYGARVCATTVLAALIRQAPDGGRRPPRERAGRDDREPARRRLPRRLARRRARRASARRGASTRAPATTSGASSRSATTSSGLPCAASSATRSGPPPTRSAAWPSASPTASSSTAT